VPEAGRDRIPLLRELARRYQCTVIGKDARTLIVSSGEREITMITNGNSGMATAGSGDVLTGMITAMISFIEDPFEAACMGVFAHGLAADKLCKKHSFQCMPLEKIPDAMDQLFKAHGF
jgi:NAD(P)H-hydrate epimerase